MGTKIVSLGMAWFAALLNSTAFAQPAGALMRADPTDSDTVAPDDKGTRVWLLGDAALNVTDSKGIVGGGIAIRGPILWFRFFVSNSTTTTVNATAGSGEFGSSLLRPESAGRGAHVMVRVLPALLQNAPETRFGGVVDLVGQLTRWEVGDRGDDGASWGMNIGATVMGEGNLVNDKNYILAYADLLLMVRGLNRDFDKSLRVDALGVEDRAFVGFGLRLAAKIETLLFSATGSWFPTDERIRGLSSSQLGLHVGIDGGIELLWAKPLAQQKKAKK
jgi:hypothetical protein